MHQISHLDLMIYLMAGMAVCCFVAVFAQPIRALVQGFFAIFYHPLNTIMENTRNAFQRIWNWVRVQLRGESSREGESPLYFVIGAVLYSALFFIFALCDLGLIVLTLEAMGFHPAKYKIYDSSTLTAAVLVSCALFWGSILTDLIGWTHLGPWRRYSSPRLQKVLLGLSLAIVVLTISIGVGLAYWRMVNLTETGVPSASAEVNTSTYLDQGRGEISGQGTILGGETSQNETLANYEIKGTPFANFVFLTAPAAIAGLSLASTVPAGWGLALLMKFAILLVIAGVSMVIAIIAFPFWLILIILRSILNCIQIFIDLLAEIGASILRLFGWRGPSQAGAAVQVNNAPSPSQPATNSLAGTPNSGQQVEMGFNPFRRQS